MAKASFVISRRNEDSANYARILSTYNHDSMSRIVTLAYTATNRNGAASRNEITNESYILYPLRILQRDVGPFHDAVHVTGRRFFFTSQRRAIFVARIMLVRVSYIN